MRGPGQVEGETGLRHVPVRNERRAVFRDLHLVVRPRVVEPRLHVDREPHRAAHDQDLSHQPVPGGGLVARDRHEVVYFAHPVRRQEPRHQHRAVGEVQLPADVILAVRRNPEVSAFVGIEQGREHARRVESRTAEPVHRSVGGDQSGRLEVTDQAVVADVRVALHAPIFADGALERGRTTTNRAQPMGRRR